MFQPISDKKANILATDSPQTCFHWIVTDNVRYTNSNVRIPSLNQLAAHISCIFNFNFQIKYTDTILVICFVIFPYYMLQLTHVFWIFIGMFEVHCTPYKAHHCFSYLILVTDYVFLHKKLLIQSTASLVFSVFVTW